MTSNVMDMVLTLNTKHQFLPKNNVLQVTQLVYGDYMGVRRLHGPPIRYIKWRVAHAPGMPGTFSPPLRVSDPDMHRCTCVTHVPWFSMGSLTGGFLWSRWQGNVPGISGACATCNFTYLVRGPWSVLQFCKRFATTPHLVDIVHSLPLGIQQMTYKIILHGTSKDVFGEAINCYWSHIPPCM